MEKTIRFRTEYFTHPGEQIVLLGNHFRLGDWSKPIYMHWRGNGQWEIEITLTKVPNVLEYKYGLLNDKNLIWEAGKNRQLHPRTTPLTFIEAIDTWKSDESPEEGYLYTSLFKDIFSRPIAATPFHYPEILGANTIVQFVLRAALVEPHQSVYVCGSPGALGGWSPSDAKLLQYNGTDFTGTFPVPLSALPFDFKFLIKDTITGRVIQWEEGANRSVKGGNNIHTLYTSIFRRSNYDWRAAGVAVPVFSLRSESGMGVGEFNDLKLLVDLSSRMGVKLIQLLPINDTSCLNTWRDSYPYSALSVFALHPIYIHIPALTRDPEILQRAKLISQTLNELPLIDYEAVMKEKTDLLKAAYRVDDGETLTTPEFAEYMESNKVWLLPYAVFKALSEKFGTTDYTCWPQAYRRVTLDEINSLSQEFKSHCDFTYYTQFHLHLQLEDVANYAKSHNVGIKGDLPIGVNLRSVDCWLNPHLFNVSMSTGAPPDQFSTDGQNWGFPTYNWEEMKKDGYKWWKLRLKQMGKYFQAFRIDHILGFFRIWEIPRSFESGLMGHFYPSIPIHRDELSRRNIWDIERLTVPYIPEEAIRGAFGDKAQYILDVYLDRLPNGNYNFKDQYNTERKILDYLEGLKGVKPNDIDPVHIKNVFLYFIKNVVLLPQPENPQDHFYPRINMNKTLSYDHLDQPTQKHLWDLYLDYFYKRQEDLWRRIGEERLPMMKMASDMLVCGEDLGMLPDCIFPVMKKYSILGLRVQRMPPDPKIAFAHPADYSYMTVCTPSSHDCSTIRGWWEEDKAKTQEFYNSILGEGGLAPPYCEPWISRKIIEQHMWSPSMWAIFPIQDFFGIVSDLRVADPKSEQINDPSNPIHYWRYRIHLTLEDLINHPTFSNDIRALVTHSGRF
uniref:4-alpha-glucanotransferase n=1 Tax=Arcella intermedia TaxID=1963864 RepID=A0A6B2KXF1_9EUKA